MKPATLYRRNLAYHGRAHIAVALSVIAATAALTGALLVGDSMRGSLRTAALDRLGRVDFALQGGRFFQQKLATDLTAQLSATNSNITICPAILARGAATHADSGRHAERVQILGVDQQFATLSADAADVAFDLPDSGRVVVLNQALADDLGAQPGDAVLLRIGKPSPLSTETLLGRRDDATLTLRLVVHEIVPARDIGAFNLLPQQTTSRNAFVPLATLQRAIEQEGRTNALLIATDKNTTISSITPTTLNNALATTTTPADLGLHLRVSADHNYVALESNAFLLEPAIETAARAAADTLQLKTTAILSYLANSIETNATPPREIPYSTVAAIAPADALLATATTTTSLDESPLQPGEILLNDWAAADLAAQPGDTIRLRYYTLAAHGELQTEQATFRLRGVVPLAGIAADSGFTPDYPGVTDSEDIADWNPPFPIDLRRVRNQDDQYWTDHHATPKAFVTLTDGQRLWANEPERLGQLTSLRIHPAANTSLEQTRADFAAALQKQLAAADLGLHFDDVRRRALAASQGTTDFGGLFVGFSFFLILAAAALVALMFRLGIERRASEVGLLLAVGFPRRQVARLLFAEGTLLASLAAAVGLLAARGYAWLMLVGLRTWWSAAANAPFLTLHETATSYVAGYAISLIIAAVSIAWSLRGLTHVPANALLAGAVQSGRVQQQARRSLAAPFVTIAAVLAAIACSTLTFAASALAQSLAFFLSGTCLLIAALAGLLWWLRIEPKRTLHTQGLAAMTALGVRNARRHRGRSILTAGLIAAASFVIVALQSMRLSPPANTQNPASGTGGFTLLAEAAVPLTYDLDSSAGREALGISEDAAASLADMHAFALRLRAGDQASCLNIYRPSQPRIFGAPDNLIDRGGFLFSATLATTDAERTNPWLLLHRTFDDNAIPVIADEASALWQFHKSLGDDIVVNDATGRERHLRIVAMLKGSFLQDGPIMAEDAL